MFSIKNLRSFVFYTTLFVWGCTCYLLFSPNPFFWLGNHHPHIPSRGAHVILFAGLAFCTYCAQTQPKILRTVLILSFFGLASECIQYFDPPRTFEWLDFFEDVLGSTIGAGVGYLALLAFRKILTWYRSFFVKGESPKRTSIAG